ncbi:hypothetical protein ACFFWD_12780 [Bradyrhizobium erythrophlei]|uniref:hypothetical protein n=1 Tax=Bradyrhizobium erythrophlei TaxID=1437360 RepID=UPI0035EAA7DE
MRNNDLELDGSAAGFVSEVGELLDIALQEARVATEKCAAMACKAPICGMRKPGWPSSRSSYQWLIRSEMSLWTDLTKEEYQVVALYAPIENQVLG